MASTATKTFKSGNSEAVRLPQGIGFGAGTKVVVERVGEVVTIRPERGTMAEMVEALRALPKLDEPWVREPFDATIRNWDRPDERS